MVQSSSSSPPPSLLKFFITNFFLASCHFIAHMSTYSPQDHVLRYPYSSLLPSDERSILHPYKITCEVIVSYVSILAYLNSRPEYEGF
jgi:hypothetical protein